MRDLSRFKPILEKMREDLIASLKKLDESYENELTPEEVELSDHMRELKRINRERSLIEDTLSKVEEALKRFDEGTYGKCIDCGGDISIERLEAVPYAQRCLECKKKYEKGLRG